jgi:hypothetical protein
MPSDEHRRLARPAAGTHPGTPPPATPPDSRRRERTRRRAPTAAGPPVRVQDTAELIATVPALIGYHPRESLVLIATEGPAGGRIGLTLRADLPPPQHVELVAADAVDSLLMDEPAGAVVIVLGERSGDADPLPHAELVEAVVEALAGHGVEPYVVAWAESTEAGAPWACYGRCRCVGVLPDPAGTVVAASVVAGGQVIRADRTELERMVAPADPARVRRRARLLVARQDAALDRPESTAGPVDGLAVVDAAVAAAADGALVLDDRTVLDLAWALSDIRVRDAALLRNLGPAAAAAEQLWAALARELPDPEAAEAAALLAVAALLRGDGALANVSLDRAQRAWPGHRLTRLLRWAAEAGVRPDQLRGWLSGDAAPTGRSEGVGAGERGA